MGCLKFKLLLDFSFSLSYKVGSAELAVEGAGFFRAIWMNEIVINKIEIRPMAIDSIEFDKAGVVELSFIAIKPGTHVLRIPGSTGESQQVKFSIQ